MEWFENFLAKNNLSVSTQNIEQFENYYQFLVEKNQHVNLTAITDKEEVFEKHFFDSLSLSFAIDFTKIKSLIDIGSGAGFPSLPLLIMFPHLHVTIVDSLNKRIQFLNELTTILKLENVTLIHGRAEDVARDTKHRDQYDLASARAVARLPILNELCLPFVKPNGHFIAMKGNDYLSEIGEAKNSLKCLKSRFKDVYKFELPIEKATRAHILIQKLSETPKLYPRKAGLPNKQPL